MTVYRLMFGVDPMAMFAMPLLFDEHPDELPRFNDAKIIMEDDKYIIEVISRIGKKYHGNDMGEEKYMNHPLFIRFEDALHATFKGDSWTDDTYGRYYFSIPEEYYGDVTLIKLKLFTKTSVDFKKLIFDRYPRMHKVLMTLFTKGYIE